MSFHSYTVWAFLLGKTSGPHRMTVCMEGEDNGGILEDQNIFSPVMHISSVAITVNDKSFRVYFDKQMHTAEHEDSIYVVLCLLSQTEAIDINLNEDMPDIVDVFEW